MNRIAAAAAEEALTDADWDLTSDRVPCEKHFRTGVSVGSGVGSLQEIEESTALILNNVMQFMRYRCLWVAMYGVQACISVFILLSYLFPIVLCVL